MAQAAGTTDTYDLVGLAEDVEDVIFNISPTETPLLSGFKREKATATLHQWQTDSLASAGANKFAEGDDSTYATATPTTMLTNQLQISKKTVMVSGTADAVRKYGRKEEFAYQLTKRGRELKRDIEYTISRDQASSSGSANQTRQMAGIEAMIAGNRIVSSGNTTGTTPGYASGAWGAVTDGTSGNLDETTFLSALEAAWVDGGDPSEVYCGSFQKRKIAAFSGATKYAGVSVNQDRSGRQSQGVIVGGIDLYISDFGEHKIMLHRYMKTNTILCLDPDYWATAWLRPIRFEERAKTGDATRGELLCEWTLVGRNPDSSAKVQGLQAS
jgi:hypothetical protein